MVVWASWVCRLGWRRETREARGGGAKGREPSASLRGGGGCGALSFRTLLPSVPLPGARKRSPGTSRSCTLFGDNAGGTERGGVSGRAFEAQTTEHRHGLRSSKPEYPAASQETDAAPLRPTRARWTMRA